MNSSPRQTAGLVSELRRRGVFRAAAVYAAGAWVIVEATATVLPALGLPDWTVTAVVVAALLGLPIVLVLAWAFDLTPEGVRRTEPRGELGPGVLVRPSRGRTLAAVAVVAGLAATGGYLAGQRMNRAREADVGGMALAVFPFRSNAASVADLSEITADLLATVLDGTQGIRISDPWSLWTELRPERGARAASPDPEEATRLAAEAGAGHYLLGSMVGAGDSIDLNVRVYSIDEVEPLYSFTSKGHPDRVSDAVQNLAVEVIARLWPRDHIPSVPDIDRYATRSADALKAYLDAKAAMRRGLVDSANAAIDRALELDSTFALALIDAVHIKSWLQYMRGHFFSGLMELAERAVEQGDSLNERNRLRARAMLASLGTDGVTAAEAVGRIIEIDDTDFMAWDNRAYFDLVYGWQYGADARDALASSERVVQLDSTHVPGLARRASISVDVGDSQDLRVQMSRLLATDTSSLLVSGTLLGLRAVLADEDSFGSLLDTIARSSVREWYTPLRYLRRTHPDRTEALLRRLRETAGPGEPDYAAAAEQARLWIAEGRTSEVMTAVEAGDYRIGELYRNLQRFLLAAALVGVCDDDVAGWAADSLAVYVPQDSALAYWESRPVWWTGWLVGAYHATFGDSAVAREWREVIGTFPPGGTSEDYRGALQSDLDARLAARRGELSEALAHARRAYELWSIHTENDWEALPAPQMRFHLALLYRANDQPDSARAMLRSLVPPTTWMGFLTARSAYELGELAENRGDLARAADHYRMAYRYWSLGGQEVAAWRDRAEAGLRRVVAGEPTTG